MPLSEVGERDSLVKIDLYKDTEYSISEIGQGESIASLLSVLDVLTGDLAPYKTVSAVALEESIIIKLPAEAISKEFENYPASLGSYFKLKHHK